MPDLIQRENRKTLVLTIMKDGRVVVKAPNKMSKDLIDKFVVEKQKWIESKLFLIRNTYEEFEDCINYKKILLYGEKYEICVGNTKRVVCDTKHKKLILPKCGSIQNALIKIKQWYKVNAKNILVSRVSHISKLIKITCNDIKISNAKSKWGACNSKKNISLNWRIVMLPPEIIDYVIIHELSHIKEMNHSQKFWNTIAMFLPSYPVLRKRLKKYSFALELYR